MSDTATVSLSDAGTPPDDAAQAARNAWVSRVLGVAVGAAPGAAAVAKPDKPLVPAGTVALQKSRLIWDSLRKSIQTQLQSLEKSIVDGANAHNADPEATDSFDPAAVAASTKQLYTVLDGLDEGLIDELDKALNASGDDRLGHQAEARKLIVKYQNFVAKDAMIIRIDSNGFMPTAIKANVEKTLAALDQTL